MRLSFVPEGLAARVDSIQITLVEECAPLLDQLGVEPTGPREQFLLRRGDPLRGLGDIEPGSYGFYALGIESERGCRIAAACVDKEISAGGSGTVEIALEEIAPTDCTHGSDGGTDGGTGDASTCDEDSPEREHDPDHCGSCSNSCSDTQACAGGTCVPATTEVALGELHSCALRVDGRVLCWGSNTMGQLGIGRVGDPVTSPTLVQGLGDARQIGAGGATTCALREHGTVVCWGDGKLGQVGDNAFLGRSSPTTVTGLSDVVHVGTGAEHNCAVLESGQVRCWGTNDAGALGIDMVGGNFGSPRTVVNINDAIEVQGGYHFTCARTEDESMYCWGENDDGQLGDGTYASSDVPRLVLNLADVKSFAVGESHVCAIRADRQILCWGNGSSGQLLEGGGTSGSPRPVETGITTGQTMSSASSYLCALLTNGTVNCWAASNRLGELGNGTSMPVTNPPATVVDLEDAVGIARAYGEAHMCALRANRNVVCWGSNNNGQLGNGELTSLANATPVLVDGL